MDHQLDNQNNQKQGRSASRTAKQKTTLVSDLSEAADAAERTDLQHLLRVMAGLIIASIVIAALYVGKDILIPLALAILLAFLLDPLVSRLKKWGCPELPAIGLTVTLALALLTGAGAYLGYQLGQLSQELPKYQSTIKSKLQSVKSMTQGPSMWDGAISTYDTVEHSIDQSSKKEPADPNVQSVKVVGQQKSAAESAMEWSDKVLNPLANAGIIFLFVILILLNRKDLHDRFLKLLGGNLNIGTDALDEAAKRIGTYLRMQLLVNATYGIPMAIGLWVIGVPAAIMWGLVAVAMRFVPYVGPMISAVFPITLAFAVDPGWNMVLWTVGLILLLELISNNIIEPWLYGESTGLSTLAIILAATFWTALWGPVGLVLSTPLTACLLVLSNYVPALNFFKVLIGSAPVLSPPQRFYQRLVADEVQDAMVVAQDYIEPQLPKDASDEVIARKVNAFYEDVAIPAVRIFSKGHNTEASAEHRLRLHQGLKLFNHAFAQRYAPKINHDQPEVYCLGARWEIDVQASAMIAHGLNLRRIPAESSDCAAIQAGSHALEQIPVSAGIICISLFHENPEAQVRLLTHSLKAQYPEAKVIFALWGCNDADQLDEIKSRFELDGAVNTMNELLLSVDALRLRSGESWLAQIDMPHEEERDAALRELDVLDGSNLDIYAQYIEEAQQAFDVKYAQISWVNSAQVMTPASPLASEETEPMQAVQAREDSICTHLVYQNENLLIEDLHRDPRFSHLPELTSNKIRFYAGVPLRNKAGLALGSLCILDRQPKQLGEDDLNLLKALADDLMLTLSNEKKKRAKQEQINQLKE